MIEHPVPFDQNFDRKIEIDPTYRIAMYHYPDGSWKFQHLCKDISQVGAPEAECLVVVMEMQHEVASVGSTITVSPSLLCTACGLHGYITAGKWVGV